MALSRESLPTLPWANKGQTPLPVHLWNGASGRECREAALEFIKDVEFPGRQRHYHHRCPLNCPVCLENKFAPRPQQPSDGGFSDQPLLATLATQSGSTQMGDASREQVLPDPLEPDPRGAFRFGRSIPMYLSYSFSFLIGFWKRRNSRCVPFSRC